MIINYANSLFNLSLNLFETPILNRSIHDLSTIIDILQYLLDAMVRKFNNLKKNVLITYVYSRMKLSNEI